MKKTMIFAAIAAMISLASCQKKSFMESGAGKNASPIFTASIAGATKTTVNVSDGKVAWELTDEITVTDASSHSAVYVIESIDATTGKATFAIKDGETALGEGPYTATYGTEPGIAQIYSATAGKLYMTAPEASDSSFEFTVQCGLMKINLTKAGASVGSIDVTGSTDVTYTLTCTEAESISAGKDFFIALPEGRYTKIAISNSEGKRCTMNSAAGVAVAANHIKPVTFGESKLNFISVPELVDLGLSVKWASFNLGATKPEEFGGYYQWAGTKDVADESIRLDWDNCPYLAGSNADTGWTKYIPSGKSSYWSGPGSPDNKTVLDPEDDVVHVNLECKWRIPTKAEWDELKNTDNCSWTWTAINGIDGYKVQSKKEGFMDNWIFLPAAGYRIENSTDYVDDSYDSYGYYWSSSLDTELPYCASNLEIDSNSVRTLIHYRYLGMSVRPVSE